MSEKALGWVIVGVIAVILVIALTAGLWPAENIEVGG